MEIESRSDFMSEQWWSGAPAYYLAGTGICIAYPMRMQLYLHDKKEKVELAAFCLCTEAARCYVSSVLIDRSRD